MSHGGPIDIDGKSPPSISSGASIGSRRPAAGMPPPNMRRPSAWSEFPFARSHKLKAILLTATDADPVRRYRSSLELRVALAVYLEHVWPGRSW
jgi:hypothetical protein